MAAGIWFDQKLGEELVRAKVLGEAKSYDELRELLAERRIELGYTQMELSMEADLPDNYVSKLELGHNERRDRDYTKRPAGREAGKMSLYRWLKPLRVKLLVVADEDGALAGESTGDK